MSSNERASFATFVYGAEGVDKINNLLHVKLIGFDAGDTIRSATVLSPRFSSLQTLQPVNTFRIDGKNIAIAALHNNDGHYRMMSLHYTGHCVTTAYPGEVCGLNSYAVSCDTGLSATACRCYQGNDTLPNDKESDVAPDALNDTSQSHDEASGIYIQTTELSTQVTEYDSALNVTSSSENSTCEGNIT